MTKNTRIILALIVLAIFVLIGALVSKRNPVPVSDSHNHPQNTINNSIPSDQKSQNEPNQNQTKLAENNTTENNISKDTKENKSDVQLSHVLNSDMVLGSNEAPVTVIEYASLSCPHCAAFYNQDFSELKKDYIDTKKVKFVYRDFPLNQPALAASMVALCYANDVKQDRINKYYDFLKILFKTQDSWAFSEQFMEKLRATSMLAGMSSARFKSCTNDNKLQEEILKGRVAAVNQLNLKATPTFIVNGNSISGYSGFQEIKTAIDKALEK